MQAQILLYEVIGIVAAYAGTNMLYEVIGIVAAYAGTNIFI